jgi:hypothetical protein
MNIHEFGFRQTLEMKATKSQEEREGGFKGVGEGGEGPFYKLDQKRS